MARILLVDKGRAACDWQVKEDHYMGVDHIRKGTKDGDGSPINK